MRRTKRSRTLIRQQVGGAGDAARLPDLIIFSPEGKAHFMEFKSENGSLNEAQSNCQLWAIRGNVPHSVVRSVDEAMQVFNHWGCLKQPREELAAE
jgi:VRR-NUC domain